MDTNASRRPKRLVPRVLIVLCVLFGAAALADVMVYQTSTRRLPKRIEEAAKGNTAGPETLQKAMAGHKEAAEKLKKRNMFMPPAPKPQPPVCVGIFGDIAVFGDRACKVGEDINGAKITAINPTAVMILWEGKEMQLYPFSVEQAGGQQDGGRRGGMRDRGGPMQGPPPGGPGGPGPGGEVAGPMRFEPPRGRFMFNMSPEDQQRMQQMRERFENASPEEREKMRAEFRARMEGGQR